MKPLSATIEIRASVGEVWELLAGLRHWPLWGPTVADVESEATHVATGVSGRVKTLAGFWLPFRITDVRHLQSWHWRVAGIPATGHSVADQGNGRCRVEFTVAPIFAPYLVILHRGLRNLKGLAEVDEA